MPVINPKIGVLEKAFSQYKQPDSDYCEGWDSETRFVQLLVRKVRKEKVTLSVKQMIFLFEHGIADVQSLKCFLPRLFLLAAFHAGDESVGFPDFHDIFCHIAKHNFADWPEDEQNAVNNFLLLLYRDLPNKQRTATEVFLGSIQQDKIG